MEVQVMNKKRLVTLNTLKAMKEAGYDVYESNEMEFSFAYKDYELDGEVVGSVMIHWNTTDDSICNIYGDPITAKDIKFDVESFKLMSAGELQLNRIREVMEQAQCDMVDILSTMGFGDEF